MTQSEFNYIKDAFSQIIDDIAGNPDWHEAARAVASDLGTLERKLEEKVSPLPSNLDEAAGQFQKIEGELVDWYSTSDGKDYCCGVKTIDSFEVPEGFYIRKK